MQKRKLDLASDGDGGDRLRNKRTKSKQATLQTSSAVNINPPKASLLGLPGELRNNIYRLAIVNSTYRVEWDDEDDESGEQLPVMVTSDPEQPGLLRCCRQLRKEASPIYYAENLFELQIFKGKLEPGPGHWVWTNCIAANNRILDCNVSGERISWGNLVEWLGLYHARKVCSMPQYLPIPRHAELSIASEAFTLVKTLEGSPWEVVKKALRSYKMGIDMAMSHRGPPFDH